MKSGTGDDPFADDATDAEESVDAETAAEEPDSDSDADSASAEPQSTVDAPANASDDADDTSGDEPDAPDIPWVLRRSSVKADRPNVTQFFLRDETDRAERRFQSDVEELLDADVYTLDLREAAYLVAMRHPDEVADELRDWGYEYMG